LRNRGIFASYRRADPAFFLAAEGGLIKLVFRLCAWYGCLQLTPVSRLLRRSAGRLQGTALWDDHGKLPEKDLQYFDALLLRCGIALLYLKEVNPG
jgi:hypothetical protein